MTTEEITAGNKLIAEFMGFTYDESFDAWYKLIDASKNQGKAWEKKIKVLQYHSSYDLLMPVWKKIIEDDIVGYNEEAVLIFNIAYERLADGDDIIEFFEQIVNLLTWY